MTEKGYFTVELSVLTRFIESIAAIAPECRLHIGTKAISTMVVDTINVAMADVSMGCEGTGTTTLGVDVSELHNAFRKIKELAIFNKDTPVRVSWYPGKGTPFIEVKIECLFEYRMQFETIDHNHIRRDPNRPTISLKSGFTCDGDALYTGVRLCSAFGERCRIQAVKKGTVYLAGKIGPTEGDTLRQNRIELSRDATVPAQTLYSIDYLKDIAKALAGSYVTVRFDTDFPISLSAEPTPELSVKYLLAPRIENDKEVGGWLE